MAEGPTDLYFHYALNGDLLYVGISLSTAARLAQHRAAATWYDQVAEVRIVKYASRKAARQAERDAVATMRPKFNVHLQDPNNEPEVPEAFDATVRDGSGFPMLGAMLKDAEGDPFLAVFDVDGNVRLDISPDHILGPEQRELIDYLVDDAVQWYAAWNGSGCGHAWDRLN